MEKYKAIIKTEQIGTITINCLKALTTRKAMEIIFDKYQKYTIIEVNIKKV